MFWRSRNVPPLQEADRVIPRLPRSLPGPSVLGAGLILTGLLFLPGCGGDTYPDDLAYGVRHDPLVVDVPTEGEGLPKRFDPPGQLPTLYLELAERGGKLLDPDVRIQRDAIKRSEEKLRAGKGEDKESLQSQIDKAKKEIANRDKAWPEFRTAFEKELVDLFGTPAHPKVASIDDAVRDDL